MMLRKHYTSAVQKIKVPEELIDDTKARLQMEQRFHTETQYVWIKRVATACASVALVIAAVVAIPAIQQTLSQSIAEMDSQNSNAIVSMGEDASVSPEDVGESATDAIIPWTGGGVDGPDSVEISGAEDESNVGCLTGDVYATGEKSDNLRDTVEINGGTLNFSMVSRPLYSLGTYKIPQGDLELMMMDEFSEYLGTDPLPEVPEDLYSFRTPETLYAYANYSKDGEILGATMSISYNSYYNENIRFPRDLLLNIGKGGSLTNNRLSEDIKPSIINGEEVWVGYQQMKYEVPESSTDKEWFYEDQIFDLYYAEVIHNGVCYQLCAQNLPQQEFVEILESILEK